MTDLPPFTGFSRSTLTFFRALAREQNREWFTAHKAEYERVALTPLTSLVAELSARFARTKLTLTADRKRSIFRIHRDVRFSRNKQPYKTHASAVLTPTGAKDSQGLLYVHIDPKGSFCAAGFYQPVPDELQLMRTAIADAPDAWRAVVRTLARRAIPMEHAETLIRVPRGFEHADLKVLDDIKLKSWVVRRELPVDALLTPALVDTLVAFAKDASPLLHFGWRALHHPPGRS